jgi:hypothetical protein
MSKTNIVDLFGDSHPVRQEASKDQDSDAPVAPQPSLHSSKEIFARLNPYFQRVLVDLATSFESFTIPDDLYSKIAEAFNIRGRGDIYSIELLLTVNKLQPFIAKKLNVRWSTIEKDIIRPLIRKHRADHYSSDAFNLDTIPEGQWFPPYDDNDMPQPWYMNIALALIRYPEDLLRYDDFEDMYHIIQKNGEHRIINADNIVAPLLELLNDTFYGKPVDERHFKRAISIIRSRRLNEFHSCKDYVDQFEAHYDPTYDWISRIVEKAAMEDSVYNRR